MKLLLLTSIAPLVLHCHISAMKAPQPDSTFDLPALIPEMANIKMPRYRCNAYTDKWNMPGKLLSSNALYERLSSQYPLLIAYTGLIENLTKEKLSLHSVVFYVDLAIHDHLTHLQNQGCSQQEVLLNQHMLEHARVDIYERIFWGHKEVIDLLRKSGYSKPMRK